MQYLQNIFVVKLKKKEREREREKVREREKAQFIFPSKLLLAGVSIE
jgi:hypothetical protein